MHFAHDDEADRPTASDRYHVARHVLGGRDAGPELADYDAFLARTNAQFSAMLEASNMSGRARSRQRDARFMAAR
jgi:hypothetical protein